VVCSSLVSDEAVELVVLLVLLLVSPIEEVSLVLGSVLGN
jgi:hypothetical protein